MELERKKQTRRRGSPKRFWVQGGIKEGKESASTPSMRPRRRERGKGKENFVCPPENFAIRTGKKKKETTEISSGKESAHKKGHVATIIGRKKREADLPDPCKKKPVDEQKGLLRGV